MAIKYRGAAIAAVDLLEEAVNAVEDGKISRNEQQRLMKGFWNVVNRVKAVNATAIGK
jgi:hypothetical protein